MTIPEWLDAGMPNDVIVCGDCLEAMKHMKDGSVSFCWTDIPYNVGKEYRTARDNYSNKDYLRLAGNWFSGMKRVSGNNMAVYTPQKYIRPIWSMLGDDYRQIILSYSPSGAIRWGFSNQFSSVLVNVKPVRWTQNVWHNCQMPGLGWFFREETYGHPGYTSEDITGRILSAFTHESDLVFDPFMGSGTTAVACIRTNRHFIGFEIDKTYCEIANKRIGYERQQLRLAL